MALGAGDGEQEDQAVPPGFGLRRGSALQQSAYVRPAGEWPRANAVRLALSPGWHGDPGSSPWMRQRRRRRVRARTCPLRPHRQAGRSQASLSKRRSDELRERRAVTRAPLPHRHRGQVAGAIPRHPRRRRHLRLLHRHPHLRPRHLRGETSCRLHRLRRLREEERRRRRPHLHHQRETPASGISSSSKACASRRRRRRSGRRRRRRPSLRS